MALDEDHRLVELCKKIVLDVLYVYQLSKGVKPMQNKKTRIEAVFRKYGKGFNFIIFDF